MRVYRQMLVVVSLCCHTLVTTAGVLDDFERDATQDRPRERHRDHYEDNGNRVPQQHFFSNLEIRHINSPWEIFLDFKQV